MAEGQNVDAAIALALKAGGLSHNLYFESAGSMLELPESAAEVSG